MSRLRQVAVAAGLLATVLIAVAVVVTLGDRGQGSRERDVAAEATPVAGTRAITVTGEGRVSIAPDAARVTLGVQVRDAALDVAQSEADTTMTAVLDALKQQGVAEERIKTVSYTMTTERDYEQPDQPITGYTVAHLVQATMTPLDKAGAVIDAAVAAGANTVNDVSFVLEDSDAATRQAREQAMHDARAKAEQLAALGGVTLGAPIAISETSAPPPMPLPGAVADSAAGAGGAPPIQGGQTEVVVSVTVSYGI